MAFRANASRLQSQRLASMIAGVLQRMASPSTRFAAMHGPGPADGSGLKPPRDFTLPRDFMLPLALVSCFDRHSRMLPHGFMSLRDPMLPRFVSHRDTKALEAVLHSHEAVFPSHVAVLPLHEAFRVLPSLVLSQRPSTLFCPRSVLHPTSCRFEKF